MASEHLLRRDLVEVCRRLYERGLIVAGDGNVSCRVAGDRFLTTPSGVCKGYLKPEQLVVVDGQGRRIAGGSKPSSEFGMHAAVYRVRDDVQAVVHAHPPIATAFSVAGVSLAAPILTEVVLTLGSIPTAPYATPGTPEVAEGLAPLVRLYDACLLDHHGAVTVGRDLFEAYYRMETLEQTAHVAYVAHGLGGARPLGPESVAALLGTRRSLGLREIPVGGGFGSAQTGIKTVPDGVTGRAGEEQRHGY
jgi:L-fuculose-phosphate aldolase